MTSKDKSNSRSPLGMTSKKSNGNYNGNDHRKCNGSR